MEISQKYIVCCALINLLFCCASSQLVLFNQKEASKYDDLNRLQELDELMQLSTSMEDLKPHFNDPHPRTKHQQRQQRPGHSKAGFQSTEVEEIFIGGSTNNFPKARTSNKYIRKELQQASKLPSSSISSPPSLSSSFSSFKKAGPVPFSSTKKSSPSTSNQTSLQSSLSSSSSDVNKRQEEHHSDKKTNSLELEELQILSEMMEEEEASLENEDVLKRVKRELESFTAGSGEIVRIIEVTFLGASPTSLQSQDGTTENEAIRNEIAEAVKIYLQTKFPDASLMRVAVTSVRAGSLIASGEILHSSDITLIQMATALNDMIGGQRFKVDNQILTVKEVTLDNENSNSQAAICYLCESHQTCVVNAQQKFYCKTSALHYFSFGDATNDLTIQKGSENVHGQITLGTGITFNDKIVRNIYIHVNGLISFGQPFNSYNPSPLPVANRDLLAPYWTDLDLKEDDLQSNVFYHLYTRVDNTPEQRAAFTKANQDIVTYVDGLTSFSALIVLIATWENVPPWPADTSSNERVNFQVAIISDGISTYAMYIYAKNGMNLNPNVARDIVIGQDDQNFGILQNYYIFDDIAGNTNEDGLWVFGIGQAQNTRASCTNWVLSNMQYDIVILSMNNFIRACPCNEARAIRSSFWLPSFAVPGCYDAAPLFQQYGRRCCYRERSLETRVPQSGSFLLYNPNYDVRLHSEWDTMPKQWCCFDNPDMCALYYRYRPQKNQNCRSLRRRRARRSLRALLFGDPHIRSIDGLDYNFNGIGEYTLMTVNGRREKETVVDDNVQKTNVSVNFNIQARTCRALNKDGEATDATVFCAIAGQDTDTRSYYVGLPTTEATYLEVYINGNDYTSRFWEDQNYNIVDNDVMLTRENQTISIFTPDNIGIRLKKVGQLIEYSVEVDSTYAGDVKGLLGNFNGEASDDFIFSNGTRLPNQSSDRQIFEFGQSWSITQETSIFTYPPGKSHADFSDPNFVPLFLDETSPEERENAEAICGSDNIPCIFDFIATKDETVALASKKADEDFVEEEKAIDNIPPFFESSSISLNTTVDQESTFTLTATDSGVPGDITYVVLEKPDNNQFTFSENEGVFSGTIRPNNLNAIQISIVARDSEGLQSEAEVVTIRNCKCENDGECDYSDVSEEVNIYYSVAKCICKPAYTGAQCESLVDACAESPCPTGTTCTNRSPQQIEQNGIFYECSNCPAGFKLVENNTKCADIDECQNSPCDVVAVCSNTIGSYKCTCPLGYRDDGSGKCLDINECSENSHKCAQICTNTVGSYVCSCEDGFTVSGLLERNCTSDPSNDPCSSDNPGCEYGCKLEDNQPTCFCSSGTTLGADGKSCADVDECVTKLCSQTCTNNVGSYKCSCYPGFLLDEDEHTCIQCPSNKYGVDCAKTCQCRGRGTCDPIKGCVCNEQWTGEFCRTDFDECANNLNLCPREQVCHNLNGTYECRCPIGFEERYNNGSCYDKDECEDTAINQCPQKCRNAPGSYACYCIAGYQYNESTNTCDDIDECANTISGCDQKCVNTEGSFNCQCNQGFDLRSDRKTCALVENVCANSQLQCSFACTIINEVPTCICSPGFLLGSDGQTCIDIDECNDDSLNLCSDTCVNNEGSYTCTCPNGKELNSDRRSCTDCDDYHWGQSCRNECNCNPKGTDSCNKQNGCECKVGWTGDNCDLDVDECNANTPKCSGRSICKNTVGSFVCTCSQGYKLVNESSCADIDECATNPCDQTCNNTVGSYECQCAEGFTARGDKCLDIDECLNKQLSGCDQKCRNMPGSFACECIEGFQLDLEDPSRKTCKAISQENCDRDCENGFCTILNTGVEKCTCKDGFVSDGSDSSKCVDINECDNNPCKGVGVNCVNRNGSFECNCGTPGYSLAPSQTECIECADGEYGTNCQSSCSCSFDNTISCSKSNGQCTCVAGWTGSNCDQDVNECDDSPCNGDNIKCINTPAGSYSCVCDTGFTFSTEQSSCQPCSSTTYGLDCASECECIFTNTKDCVDTNGTCVCKTGWTGPTCNQDVDECSPSSNFCPNPLEVCNNLQGSAECLCKDGYFKVDGSCKDKNECLLSTSNCDAPKVCNNTVGSYECICDEGYLTEGDSCVANFDSYFFNLSLSFSIATETKYPATLKDDIETAIFSFALNKIGDKLLKVIVREIRNGSVIADTEIQINKLYTNTSAIDAAILLKDISAEPFFSINGENASINFVQINNTNYGPKSDVCDTYLKLTGPCESNSVCKENSGIPTCEKQDDDDNTGLIIGLGVGIPFFAIVCIIVAIAVYFYARDKKRDSALSTPSHDRDDPFHSVFASKMAPKGAWGAPHRFGMYSPDTFSEAGTSDSSTDGHLMKSRQKVRSDFQDSPWYQNQGATPRDMGHGSQEAHTESGGPTSNFSWEYMFKLLEPHKGFELQRPNVSQNPNPAYQPLQPGGSGRPN